MMNEPTRYNQDAPAHGVTLRKLWLSRTPSEDGVPRYHPFTLLLHRADLLEKTGEWEPAETVYQRSADWCRRAGYRAELAEAIIWLCRLRRNMGKCEGQLPMVAESLEISRTLGDVKGVIRGHDNLALIHFFEGRLDEAAAEFHTAIKIAERDGLERLSIAALGNLARAQMMQGDYEQSIAANLRVIELCRKHGDENGVATAHCNLGNVYFYQSRYDLAMECYQKQAAQFRRSGDILSYSVAVGNIGNIYYITGSPGPAMECYREKLKLSERLGFASGIGQALGNIANLLLDAGDLDGAIASDIRVLEIAEQSGDAALLVPGLIDLGELMLHKGELSRSLGLLDRAVEISRAAGVAYDLAMALVKRADTRLRLGDRAGARRDAIDGQAAAERIGDDEITLEGALAGAKAADDRAQGIAEMLSMINRFPGDQYQSLIFYELYGLTGNQQHRARALELCRSLDEKSPNYLNRQRIAELEGTAIGRAPAGEPVPPARPYQSE
jgi:tetratricopeptide (TPR) repeat protein